MIASTRDTAVVVAAAPESATRALLRHVDRAALDQLLAAFAQAVALPAAVLSPTGAWVAGQVSLCPACATEGGDSIGETLTQQSGTSGWIHCRHGQASMVLPVSTRTGEQLAAVSV